MPSCYKDENVESLHLDDSVILTKHEFYDISCDLENLITAGESGIYTLSLINGVERKISDFSCSAVDVVKNELFCYGNNEIQIININGKEIEIYDLNLDSFEISKIDRILGSKNYVILFGYKSNTELLNSKMLLIDRRTSEIVDVTYTMDQFNEINLIRGADFVSESQIVMVVKPNSNLSNDANVLVKYDVNKKEIISKDLLPYASECYFANGIVYYLEGENVRGYDYNDGSRALIKRFTKEEVENTTGTEWIELNTKLMIIDNYILLASPYIKTVVIEKLKYDDEVLTILVPDNVNFYWENQEQISYIEQELKVDFEIKELPKEYFKEKLNLKYLDHDTSFDIILFPDVNDDLAFKNIIDKGLYHPLNEFVETYAVFNNSPLSRDIVEQNGNIVGLPWELNYYFLDINEVIWQDNMIPLPEKDITIEDIWELCEYISDQAMDIYVFNDSMEIVCYMINQWIENDVLNKSELLRILENCVKYADILAPKPNGTYQPDVVNALYNINWKYSLKTNMDSVENKVSIYPLYKNGAPNYAYMNSVLLINPYTKKTALAAQVMCQLAEEHYAQSFINSLTIENAKPYLISGSVANVVVEVICELYDMNANDAAEKIYAAVNMMINE